MTQNEELQANRERIGIAIKVEMIRQKMTQKELADKAGITQACVRNVQKGSFSVGLDQLYKICTALNMTIELIKKEDASEDASGYSV